MQTYKCHAKVSKDHQLHVPLPDEIPEGDVEVVIFFRHQKPRESQQEPTDRMTALRQIREKFGPYLSSSEEFARSKQYEIDWEERKFER